MAQELECDFLEGDRRHPLANITKMIAQEPLQEADRLPWLLDIESDIQRAIARNQEIVITCSALKLADRQQLASLGRVQLVWLDVPILVLEQRLSERSEHYMKPEMLDSQIAAFESIIAEENIITIEGNCSIDTVMNELMIQATQRFPNIQKSWWQRCSKTSN